MLYWFYTVEREQICAGHTNATLSTVTLILVYDTKGKPMEMTAAVWIGIIAIVTFVVLLIARYFLSRKVDVPQTPFIDLYFPDATETSKEAVLSIFRKINLLPYVTIVDSQDEASMVVYTKSNTFGWSYGRNQIEINIPLREGVLTNEQTDFMISTFAQIFSYVSNVTPTASNSMLAEMIEPPLVQSNGAEVFNVQNSR